MPKSQFLDPNEVRKSSFITFQDIPVNQYNKTIKEESKNYSKDDFMRIYRDMAIIREFETMLYQIKTTNHLKRNRVLSVKENVEILFEVSRAGEQITGLVKRRVGIC